ncbi:MAG: YihA family ribosome biogenesis GTP-binding protein [Ignavibacteria bacterium CG_4_8_14_3_um_filter_37_9]|nr:YihA family ribosome biogenesis GTP-binding protein [Ignavibacteria bacterium]OIO24122.1 MAG: GTP-binding protein [Ignavibacteria bacterium CG1_02_37_35]PIW98295.1 MAG: YihA family ribosome biogenesis GTP-binding protein [Ignavibacteria bacterium CG_4_8_14_3_um_filter_37_9]PIX95474.1 MAG: YihA family ribosome biogenesis GTP-binding protein [Ignavibacteria bacterium CG_4_10_14_3_um_filter_37_18]PJC59377.1 MAG: YihA family ribosome biogenesis GTP-binding protein [Ignavibacteria bacterium CG_4_
MHKELLFKKSVYAISELPTDTLPEVVLCGRSNVGKSSFINSFYGKKNLAKVSSDPGKTRSLNFYEIDKSYYVVDLPGFGYAKIGLVERKRWGKLIEDYFRAAKSIALIFHFIDSRHEPMQSDIDLYNMISFYHLPYFIILSKADKLNQSQIASAKKMVSKYFPDFNFGTNLFFYSILSGKWKREIEKQLYCQLDQVKFNSKVANKPG